VNSSNQKRVKNRLLLLVVVVVRTIIAAGAGVPAPAYRSELKIPYCTVDGKVLTLNAFLPVGATKPVPVMVDIHGGWWSGGEPATGIPEYLAKRGIAMFSISYRLGEQGGFPQNIRDCRNAIRFIRKNAARFNIDPNRIDCMGGSAGGHLSLMVAMVPDDFDDGGPTDELKGYSARVSGCFGFIAPTDFIRFWNQGPDDVVADAQGHVTFRSPDPKIPYDSRPRLRILFHGITPDSPEHMALYRRMCPMGHVRKDVPPLLICDGDIDPIVPGLHGKLLHEKLQSLGADTTYWMSVNGGHAFPSGSGFMELLDAFLTRTLQLTE